MGNIVRKPRSLKQIPAGERQYAGIDLIKSNRLSCQSEAENNIHRAAEWSITKSYDQLREIFEKRSEFPDVEPPSGDDWLESMIAQGAELSHRHYNALIERYDFAKGRRDPPRGLDQVSREFLAQLVGYAAVSFARVLECAFDEANIKPDTIRDWQDQAKLVCQIPNLRGHDAQILVACGYRDPAVVAEAAIEALLTEASEFAESSAGQRVIRSGKAPDREEVTDWIRWAGHARLLRAA